MPHPSRVMPLSTNAPALEVLPSTVGFPPAQLPRVEVNLGLERETVTVHKSAALPPTHLGVRSAVDVAMWTLHALAVVVFVISLWQIIARSSAKPIVAWCVGGFFVCLAVPLSLRSIQEHLAFYVSPLQRHYVRCLALVPIYALECAWRRAAARAIPSLSPTPPSPQNSLSLSLSAPILNSLDCPSLE